MSEKNEAQNPALLAAGARSDVLIWRQQSGVFRAYDDPTRIVRVGLPGMADAGGIVAVTITPDMVGKTIGVAIQPEFKSRTGRQAESQHNWQAAVEQRGGVYRLIRNPDAMLKFIDDVKAGRCW